ncbi:hypothetical protein Acr_25g0008070 [Actinidia rufa]|uniref:Uncharacterized protein n=1 Tax=Actinidia rufa TaxID=165716 RepID=A0A7J0H092_9ERIC|nr:hypothetical protein Acr_25g0008070 [Actinidia rufa]
MFAILRASRLFFRRNMSAAVGEGVEKIEYMSDVAEVIADRTVDAVVSAAPAVSEIAVCGCGFGFPCSGIAVFDR